MNKIASILAALCLFILNGCASPNQMFSGAELSAVSNDCGRVGNESASASYTVASITSNGGSVDVVSLKGENDFVIKAAAIIPFDMVLTNMPRTVSEALKLCTGVDAALKLNVNTRTDDVVWLAKADGSINTLFMTLSKPGMILNTDVDIIVHFTFTDHKLVRVDQRQIIAWSRGQGINQPAAPASPPPAPPASALPDPRSLSMAPPPPPADPVRRPDGLGTVTSVEPVQPPPSPVALARGPTPLPPPPPAE